MESIYTRLRQWRLEQARLQNVPSFFILSNRHLAGVAVAMPVTLEQVAECPGMGPKKLEQFGPQLAALVAQAVAEGLESGVELVAPPAPESPRPDQPELTTADLAEIAAAFHREVARQVAKRLKGRYTIAQVEKALRSFSLPA